MSSQQCDPPPGSPQSPSHLLQAFLKLLQGRGQPLVLGAQLGDQVHAIWLLVLLLVLGRRERSPGPPQQGALLLQPAHLELQLVHLGPNTRISPRRDSGQGEATGRATGRGSGLSTPTASGAP